MTAETAETRAPFPERMHSKAAEVHARRARAAYAAMIEKAEYGLKALDKGTSEPESASEFAGLAYRLGVHLSALEVLHDVREWEEAEETGGPS